MVIVINTLATSKVKVGVANYLHGVVHGLADIDKENEYLVCVGKGNKSLYEDLPDNFKLKEVGFWNMNRYLRLIWEQLILPGTLNKTDVLWSPGFVSPIWKRCKYVLTIHDMTFFTHPEVHTLITRMYYKIFMGKAAKKADKIICVSEYTKNEVMRLLGVPEEKLIVSLESCDERFVQIEGERKKYVLFVGMLEPRKNVVRLIEACKSLPEPYKLLVAGKKGWMCNEIFEKVKTLGMENKVEFLGYVEDEKLPKLYQEATVFVYPSLHEGFGIPVLEAMRCGCPVITSNVSSLPEVGGEAALYVKPKDVVELEGQILKVIGDPQLRKEMSIKGLEQAKKFNWKDVAIKTLEALC